MLVLSLSHCASSQLTSTEWQSPLLQAHPLVGQIWRVHDRRFIDVATLQKEVSRADYLLLGEKHDNPDHHLLRQQLVMQLQPEIALVSFEMLDHSQQPQLDALAGANPESADIRAALDWDDEGWNWDFYGPLLSALLAEGVSVRAANISRADEMEAYAGELNQTAATVLTPEQLLVLEQEIDASHCGMLPASQFAAMVRVQQARDYHMAGSLLGDLSSSSESGINQSGSNESAGGEERPVAGVRVLVAGNYHVRKDLGVPKYLQALYIQALDMQALDTQTLSDNADVVLTVAFLEVAETMTDPQMYLETQYAADAFDYVWFTPAAAAQDYCAAFQ